MSKLYFINEDEEDTNENQEPLSRSQRDYLVRSGDVNANTCTHMRTFQVENAANLTSRRSPKAKTTTADLAGGIQPRVGGHRQGQGCGPPLCQAPVLRATRHGAPPRTPQPVFISKPFVLKAESWTLNPTL